MSLRKILIPLLSCTSALLICVTAQADLLITGLFDGPLDGGEPKVVELYAANDIPDLSIYGAGAANNGGGTDGVEMILSGSASAGDFLYIVDDNSDSDPGVEFEEYFGFLPSLFFDSNAGSAGGPAAINGDDAVELFHDPTGAFTGDETVIDVFGDINTDGSGEPWDYLDGWAYRNNGTGPDGSTFVLDNWSFSGVDAVDGKTTNSPPNEFPIGSYVIPEPTSAMLLLAGLFGLATRRRS